MTYLLYEGSNALDFTGPMEAFRLATEIVAQSRPDTVAYRQNVASLDGGPVTTTSGLVCMTSRIDDSETPGGTLILPGGPTAHRGRPPQALIDWIIRNEHRFDRVCSVCTGAFLLAEAGLLDGLRAVTHWAAADALAARFPTVSVDPSPLFLRQGRIWTSAGIAAGIDLALGLVDEDWGHHVSMRAARTMVVFMRRIGPQAQASEALDVQERATSSYARLHAWIAANLSADLSVGRLAERMGVAQRTFERHYTRETGQSPARMVERMRLDAALRAIESSDISFKEIALRTGFGDERRMRRALLRHQGHSPSEFAKGIGRPR